MTFFIVYSTVPDEILQNSCTQFSMRHTAGGILTHVDGTSVAAIGYLPQDMIGKSVMDFYHPGDMALMKDVYETVAVNSVKNSTLYRSKPYRFQIQNGCYITLETEWTSIINPWSHQLEFIIGHNRVLRGNIFAISNSTYFIQCYYNTPFMFIRPLLRLGPKRLDIFTYAPADVFPTTVMEASKSYRSDIINSLAKPMVTQEIQMNLNDTDRLKVLASVVNFYWSKDHRNEVHIDAPPFERETVALGAISPHHEHDENSHASSATPPSYNQLNYNSNINRYFNSNPLISGDCDGAIAITNSIADDERPRQKTTNPYMASTSTSNTGTTDTSDSFDQLDTTDTSTSTGGIPMILLTTDLLLKHNDDMEKNMLKDYKDTRHNLRVVDKLHDGHGVKRCGSKSRVDEQQKNAKKQHMNNDHALGVQQIQVAAPNAAKLNPMQMSWPAVAMANVPFGAPVTISNAIKAQCAPSNVIRMPAASGFYPTIYYVPAMPFVPTSQIRSSNVLTASTPAALHYTTAGVQGLMYSQPPPGLKQPYLYQSSHVLVPSMPLQQMSSPSSKLSRNAMVRI